MNPENQNFERLQRLLKLKRYEQPPPRYFNDFSGQVINRIRAGQPESQSEAAAAAWEASWLQRVLSIFEAKPLLAGAFGLAVVGVLVGGAFSSDEVEIPVGPSSFAGTQMPLPVAPAPAPAAVELNSGFALVGGNGTNVGSLFDRIGTPSGAQPVNYTPFQR
jgi:hypothetical protein